MYVCMYVYFNEWRSDRVLFRLGLNRLMSWLHADVCMYVCTCMYVCNECMYVCKYVYFNECMYVCMYMSMYV